MSGLLRLIFLVAAFFLLRRLLQRLRTGLGPHPSVPSGQAGGATPAPLSPCAVCGIYVAVDAGPCARATCPRKKASGSFCSVVLAACLFLSPSLFLPLSSAHAGAFGGGRYLVEIEGEQADVVFHVNHVPVERWVFTSGKHRAGASFNHWIRQGKNSLALTLTPLAAQGTTGREQERKPRQEQRQERDQGQAQAQAQARVHVWFVGVTAAGGMQVVDILRQDLRAGPSGQGKTGAAFTVPSAPSLSLWQTENVTDPPSTGVLVQAVASLGREMKAAQAGGHALLDVPSLSLEREDTHRAYGASSATQPLLEVLPSPGQNELSMGLLPREADVAVTRVEGEPLWHVGRKDGTPLLEIRGGAGAPGVQAVLVGRNQGGWRIIRRCY